MIDWLTLRVPFKREYFQSSTSFDTGYPVVVPPLYLSLSDLSIPLEVFMDADGDKTGERHPWESIPSSFSGMGFKVFDFRHMKEPVFYVEIQSSPAKLMQGHNIFGTDCLKTCSLFMLDLLSNKYPVLSGYLDFDAVFVDTIDLTYFSRAESSYVASQFLTFLSHVSKGQTKSRHGFRGETVYFGKKNSRLKKLKVYLKPSEVENFIKKETVRLSSKNKKVADLADYKLSKIYTPDLLAWCEGMIRWEARLKHRWFERRGISCLLTDFITTFDSISFWQDSFSDIFQALGNTTMNIINDETIEAQLLDTFKVFNDRTKKWSFTKAKNAYSTYCLIKSLGYIEAHRITSSRATFYNHLSMLSDIGVTQAYLQNMKGGGHTADIIPVVQFITVDFNSQYPPFYKAA